VTAAGQPIRSADDLAAELRAAAGTIELTVMREGDAAADAGGGGTADPYGAVTAVFLRRTWRLHAATRGSRADRLPQALALAVTGSRRCGVTCPRSTMASWTRHPPPASPPAIRS